MKRIEWLDFLKGVAILSVVMGHVAHGLGKGHHWSDLIIIFEMPLFFMLSGILANKTASRPLSQNLKKKIQSLIIPFIFWGSIYGYTFNTYSYFIFDLYHQGYWFLLSLCFCWIIFLSLHKFNSYIKTHSSFNRNILEFIILIIPFLIYKYIESIIPYKINEALTLNFTFTYYRFFVLGYFIGKFLPTIKMFISYSENFLGLPYLILLISTILFVNGRINSDILPMTIIQIITVLTISNVGYLCYKLSITSIRRLVCYIGKNSISIYLFHFFITRIMVISWLNGFFELSIFIIIFILSIIISIVCIIILKPIENNKYTKILLGK